MCAAIPWLQTPMNISRTSVAIVKKTRTKKKLSFNPSRVRGSSSVPRVCQNTAQIVVFKNVQALTCNSEVVGSNPD